MKDFAQFLEDNALTELKSIGRKFNGLMAMFIVKLIEP